MSSVQPALANHALTMPAPATARPSVVRQRLAERVLQSQAALVLYIAPAGFGKTTAMLQLREALIASGLRTAWLTLDRGDNDPQRFLEFLGESLQLLTTAGDVAPFGLDMSTSAPLALFLDDFDAVSGGSVSSIVRDLLDQLPRGSRVVIGARQQPGFGLARLRANGAVLDFGMTDLQFSGEESRQFLLGAAGADLPESELALLQERTEGWPAAIALASMALAQRDGDHDFIRQFSATTQSVSDYLSEVVLNTQPADYCKFLLATSILRSMNVEVCQALLPGLDCAFILERLHASNLLVTQVAGQPGQWRYHPLFSDFLRVRLLRENQEDFQRLHLAASSWYETHQQIVPAIDHAIAGDDQPHAADLLADHVRRFIAQGRLRLLARWFAVIPAAVLRPHPHLVAFSLWTKTLTQGAAEGKRQFETLRDDRLLDDSGFQDHILALQCSWLLMLDQPGEAYAVGTQALARLPTREAYADSVLSISMAILMAQRGERDKAHQLLDAARVRLGDASFMRMYIESAEGEQDLQDGLLRQATARFRIAVGASRQTSTTRHDIPGGNAWAGVLYAVSCYEADRLDEAQRLLKAYLPIVQSMGMHEHQILTLLCLSRIARVQGNVDEAVAHLADLEHAGMARGLPRLVASAWLERAREQTTLGRAEAAADALARADLPGVWIHDHTLRRLAHSNLDLRVAKLRWALHFGDPRRALSEIDAELAWSRSTRWPLRTLTLQLLRAIGLRRVGLEDTAVDQMREVLSFAAEQGFVRRVLDEGPLVLSLASALMRRVSANDDDPILVEYLRRLLKGVDTVCDTKVSSAPAGLMDKLTSKEMQALQLIAEGYSNNAMAEKLGVSTNTIRAHLRSINSKLDVSSRMQAVVRARKLGLLR